MVNNWLIQFFSDINWLTWGLLSLGYYTLNVLCTKNALYTYKLKSVAAANTGVLIYILSFIGVAKFIETPNNIIPIIIASWFGEFTTIEWEKWYKEYKDEKTCELNKDHKSSLHG